MCNSVGPYSRHRSLQVSEINSDQGQISKKHVMFLEMSSPTNSSVYTIFSASTVSHHVMPRVLALKAQGHHVM